MPEDPTYPPNRIQIDEESFFQLYERYWHRLYAQALKYLPDNFQAEEVVQDLFTSLWQRKEKLELFEDTIENYLVRAVRFRIARVYSDEARKVKKMEEFHLRNSSQQSNSTEKQVLYNFLREDVDKLVKLLPERCRAVYLLSRVKGLNNREIAVNLLISEKTVENQLTKALNFIRKGLREYPAT